MKIYITKILLLFLSFCIIFLGLKKEIFFYKNKEIEIKLEGYILNKGIINIKKGSKYKDLISFISYYDDTDLNILAMDYPLYNGQILFFEKLNRTKININTANIEELCTLPGIGLKTAQKIIDYRHRISFKKKTDLTKISGIGEKKYEILKEYITI